MYRSGLTVLPVCPTCLSLPIHPASTLALDDVTSPPNSSASSFNTSKYSGLPIPLPPDTRTLDSVISTLALVSLTTSLIFMFMSAGVNSTLNSSTSPVLESSFGRASITPGLTVAI